jgi:hypothetical protein
MSYGQTASQDVSTLSSPVKQFWALSVRFCLRALWTGSESSAKYIQRLNLIKIGDFSPCKTLETSQSPESHRSRPPFPFGDMHGDIISQPEKSIYLPYHYLKSTQCYSNTSPNPTTQSPNSNNQKISHYGFSIKRVINLPQHPQQQLRQNGKQLHFLHRQTCSHRPHLHFLPNHSIILHPRQRLRNRNRHFPYQVLTSFRTYPGHRSRSRHD